MNKTIHALANRMTANLAGIIGILTSLVLACAAAVLTLDLLAYSSAETAATSAVVAGPVSAAAGEAVSKTVIVAALILGLAIIAPLVGAFSLFLLLKRYSRQMGPLIHIEYGSAPPVVVGPFAARNLGIAEPSLDSLADAVARKRRLESLDVQPQEMPSAETFDLGPTLEEELSKKRSQAGRQEEAVLAQLFADNLMLHEKIELDNQTEIDQEAATETNNSQ